MLVCSRRRSSFYCSLPALFLKGLIWTDSPPHSSRLAQDLPPFSNNTYMRKTVFRQYLRRRLRPLRMPFPLQIPRPSLDFFRKHGNIVGNGAMLLLVIRWRRFVVCFMCGSVELIDGYGQLGDGILELFGVCGKAGDVCEGGGCGHGGAGGSRWCWTQSLEEKEWGLCRDQATEDGVWVEREEEDATKLLCINTPFQSSQFSQR